MTVEEYLELLQKVKQGAAVVRETREIVRTTDRKVKRKVSAYNRKYKAALVRSNPSTKPSRVSGKRAASEEPSKQRIGWLSNEKDRS